MYKFYAFGIGLETQEKGMYCKMMDGENVCSNLTKVTWPSLPIFVPSSFKCVVQTLKNLSTCFPNSRIIPPLGQMRESSSVFQDLKKKKKEDEEKYLV